jgi:putative transposase
LLDLESVWSKQFAMIENWSAWLAGGDEAEELQILRRNVEKGLPCGAESFVHALGKQVGRMLMHRSQGRPKKIHDDEQ